MLGIIPHGFYFSINGFNFLYSNDSQLQGRTYYNPVSHQKQNDSEL